MIKEFLERRRKKKMLRIFREDMSEMGIFTSHLTDDELLIGISIWTANMVRVLKSLMLSTAQVAGALKVVGEAIGNLNLRIK